MPFNINAQRLEISPQARSAALQEEAMNRIKDRRLWNLEMLDHLRPNDWDSVVFYTCISGHDTWWILKPCGQGVKLRIDEIAFGLEMKSNHWKTYGKPGFTATVKIDPWRPLIVCSGYEISGGLVTEMQQNGNEDFALIPVFEPQG